jgi:hypothetical protein
MQGEMQKGKAEMRKRKVKGYREEQRLTWRVVGLLMRRETIRRLSPVPRCRGL